MAEVTNIAREADRTRRSKISTIRSSESSATESSAGFVYASMSGTNVVEVKNTNPKSMLLCNTHETLATKISVSGVRTGETVGEVFMLHEVVLPVGASIFLEANQLASDSKTVKLNIKLTSASGTPTASVTIRL